MDIAIAVGNPRPKSRTWSAARKVASELADLGGARVSVELDLVTLGPALLGWGEPTVERAVAQLCEADVVVVASPTFKASYSGLLKLFLDHVPADGLAGTVALPLMVGGNPHHAHAPELLLRPLLTELGATCPVRGHYLLDSETENPVLPEGWLSTAAAVATALRIGSDEVAS